MKLNSIICPTCHATLRASRPPSGDKQVSCPQCGTPFVVSAAAFTAEPPVRVAPRSQAAVEDFAGAAASARAVVPPPLVSRGMGFALVGAVLLVGAGIIGAILVTRRGPAPEPASPPPRAEAPPPQKSVPDEAELQRAQREKRRPEYLRRMIEAGTAVNAQHYEDAVRAYGEALKLFPEDADAQRGLTEARAALAARSRDKEEADKRQVGFTRFLEQGKEAMAGKQYAAAVRAFQQAVQLMPADDSAAKSLTEAQTALAADDAQKKKLEEYQTHMTAGQAALAAGRYADALHDYLAALRIMPGDAAALEGQRLAEGRLAALEDQQKAKTEFTRLLDQAATALRNQRFAEAIDGYNAALKLFKDDPAAARGLAEAQQGLANLQAEFTRQLAFGDAAMKTARYADAILAFREAVRLNPGNALAAKALQDAQAALATLQNGQAAIATIQNGQAAYLQLMDQGAVALRTRRFADAVQAYTGALQLVPNDPAALQGLRDARAGLDRVAMAPGDFDREMRLAKADLQQQRFKEAIRHFKHALKLKPEDPQAERGLRQARFGEAMADGRAALTARRFADAVRSFEEALRERPGDPTATAALRQARTLANQNAKGP